ncbi:MAG: hypothetical protein GX092_01590 [Clostridia bacterium]|nr:hypothetical protein [Clostridia bacterium]
MCHLVAECPQRISTKTVNCLSFLENIQYRLTLHPRILTKVLPEGDYRRSVNGLSEDEVSNAEMLTRMSASRRTEQGRELSPFGITPKQAIDRSDQRLGT